MIKTSGILQCSPAKIARVLLDDEIARMYRSLIPKYKKVCIPMHSFHLSVVRYFEKVKDEVWGKHGGRRIEIFYEDYIYEDDLYYWLNAQSDQVGDIREELGLPRIREGYNCYHLTIGNKK